MTKDDVRDYLDSFNRKDFAGFGKYYAEDVVLDLSGKRTLNGRDAILTFYRDVATRCDEKLTLRKIVMDEEGVAIDLDTEFKGLVDDPGFIAGPLVPGRSIFIKSFIFYTIRDGQFAHIMARRVSDATTGPATF